MNNIKFIEIDILIIGAGIAGCISAMSLHHDFKIAVVEKGKSNESCLTETLIASSKRIFKELDVQDWLLSDNCQKTYRPCDGSVSYWGEGIPVYTDALRNPEGANWVLNKKEFLRELRSYTRQFPFPLLDGKVHSLYFEDGFWNIEIKMNDEVTRWYKAKFIIDASGRAGVISRKLGVKRNIEDKLICISAIIDNPSANLLSKTFAEKNGWWFICPLDVNKIQISYYTDADLVSKSLTSKAEEFQVFIEKNAELRTQIGVLNLNDFQFLGTYAANTCRLEQFCDRGWVAIGDAAMCFDPLSSQGSFKAMATAMQLTHLLKNCDFISNENKTHETMFQGMFNQQMEKIWLHYKNHQKYYYQLENKRRQSCLFWERRIVG